MVKELIDILLGLVRPSQLSAGNFRKNLDKSYNLRWSGPAVEAYENYWDYGDYGNSNLNH